MAGDDIGLPIVSGVIESSLPVTDGLYMDQMFEDLTVPVYTTLKGVSTLLYIYSSTLTTLVFWFTQYYNLRTKMLLNNCITHAI